MSLKISNPSKKQNGKIKKVLKEIRLFRNIIRLGEALYKLSKASLGADELKEVGKNLFDDITHTARIDKGSLPVEDYLQGVKKTAQVIASNTRIFSKERQSFLKKELDIIYQSIQTDKALSDDEKQNFLRIVAEIRDIVQPPSPPRNPPNR